MMTSEAACSILDYDPADGSFVWKRGPRGGRRAGTLAKTGYVQIGIGGKLYLAHRLAWLMIYGAWPEMDIDHANRRRDDNRIANLRIANRTQNIANAPARRDSTSGLKGAFWRRDAGRWTSRIRAYGKTTCLGFFDTAEQAAAAYAREAAVIHGQFAITKAITGASNASVRAAEALVDQANQGVRGTECKPSKETGP